MCGRRCRWQHEHFDGRFGPRYAGPVVPKHMVRDHIEITLDHDRRLVVASIHSAGERHSVCWEVRPADPMPTWAQVMSQIGLHD